MKSSEKTSISYRNRCGDILRRVLGAAIVVAAIADLATAADPDVFEAARSGDAASVDAYVAAGGDVNVQDGRGYTPFILAAYHGHVVVLEKLVAAGAEPCATDERGNTAFMGVAFKGNVDAARWIVENTRCDVDHRNGAGQTALMMASLFGREEIISLLLERGADASATDMDGNSAESLAEGQGLSGVVQKIRFALKAA